MIAAAQRWAWDLQPLTLVAEVAPLLVVALAYQRRCRTLAQHERRVARWRQGSFYGGLVLVLLAVASPLAHLSEQLFSAHMVQHIVLGDLGALGLVLGLTGPLLAPVLRPRVARVVRPLAHPALALPLWMVNLYGWHLSALYQASLEHPLVHALMHAGFVSLGIAMWMPLFGPLPTPRWFTDWVMLLYVFMVRLAGALLANFFIWTQSAVYPDYAEGQRLWGIEPLADQGLAGGILMIEGSVITLGALLWLFLRAAQRQEDTQQLLDFAADHDIELSPARAARAVQAGRADALRARLADPERW